MVCLWIAVIFLKYFAATITNKHLVNFNTSLDWYIIFIKNKSTEKTTTTAIMKNQKYITNNVS